MKYLDPKADLTFKKIFGNHPDRLKNLLNSLLSLNEDELIQQNFCRTGFQSYSATFGNH